jgi:hypothetical protein
MYWPLGGAEALGSGIGRCFMRSLCRIDLGLPAGLGAISDKNGQLIIWGLRWGGSPK